MQTQQASKWIRCVRQVCLFAALALVSCGGGEQSGGIQGSGRTSPALVVGPITGFGSVFVNGVEYTTSSAQIRIDGQPATEAQLRVGQIVTLRATVEEGGRSGTADEVSFRSDATGPVSDLDVVASTFVVAGQLVRVTSDTRFGDAVDPADIGGLQNGAVVIVSGFPNAQGDLVASRVDAGTANGPVQATGPVAALDAAARTFRINSLIVDYSTVTSAPTLSNGTKVTVRGTIGVGGALAATTVELASATGAATDAGEIEGFITSYTSDTDFAVASQRITTSSSTQRSPANFVLAANARVRVRGVFNSVGVLVADRIDERRAAAAVVAGVVDSVSSANNTLTVLGVAISTSAETSFEDKSDQRLRPFRLSDVRTGDYVRVRGAQVAGAGPLVATALDRERPSTVSWLQSVALNVAAPNLTVLGVNAMTNAQTQYLGLGGPQQAEGRFFAEARNQVVKLRGSLTGSVFVIDQAQILR